MRPLSTWTATSPTGNSHRILPEIRLLADRLKHGDLYRLNMHWPGGNGTCIPSYDRRVVQDPQTYISYAQVWHPNNPYLWKHPRPTSDRWAPLIYASHVSMAQEEPKKRSEATENSKKISCPA